MDARLCLKVAGLVCAACLVFISGCAFAAPENEITWGWKAATGRLTETTPTEWQAVANRVNAFTPDANVSLTDEQAQAIVDFIQANDLNSIQEVTQLIDQVQTDPNSVDVEIPESVTDLFGADGFGAVAVDLYGA